MGIDLSRRAVLASALTVPALLASSAAASASERIDRAGFDARLRELETAYPGRIGVTAFATGTGVAVGYRAHERFAITSTFKVLAASAILRKARWSDPGLLDRLIHYDRSQLVASSPITAQHVDTGLTVAQLCDAAITVSDNTAGNLLLAQLGGPHAITVFSRTLGDFRTRLDRWETDLNTNIPGDLRDTTTPASMARNLHSLTLGHALVADDRTRLTNWLLANKTGGGRIRAGLPSDWTVADKTGAGDYGAINDIAVVWPPGSAPIVISIYTTRTDPNTPGDNRIVADMAGVVAGALGPR